MGKIDSSVAASAGGDRGRSEVKMMKREDAKRAIIAEWLRLPPSERKTGHQAAAFAMQKMQKYQFRGSGDRYQTINGWLQRYIDSPL